MKALAFALILGWCCSFIYGAVFDPYSRRHNLRNASFETLFPTTAKNDFQSKINAAPVIDNVRCKSAYTFASASTLSQLINFQYELIELCPKVYESIRYTNITTWGPVEEFMQIWYMRFVDFLWLKIQARTSTCRCVLYDDFITAAQTTSDTVLLQYLQNNYDPSLCEINDQTMYKWHQFLQRPQIKNRNTNFLKVGDFSIQLVQALAKSYLTDARYDSYFEAAPEYPLITYFTATLSSPSYTTTQKGFIKQLTNYFKQQFPTLTLANRKDIFSKKFTESIDLSYSYFKCLNSIPLDPADGITHYDLLLYVTRRDFLIAKRLQYNTSPTNACGVTTTSTTTKAPTTSTSTSTALPTTTVACTETAVCAHGFIPKKNCGKWSCYRDYANIPAEWRGYWGVTHVCEWTWPGSFAISIHCKEENDWTKANYFYFFIGLYIPEGLPWAPGLFRWTDGTAVDFTDWAPPGHGSPNQQPANEFPIERVVDFTDHWHDTVSNNPVTNRILCKRTPDRIVVTCPTTPTTTTITTPSTTTTKATTTSTKTPTTSSTTTTPSMTSTTTVCEITITTAPLNPTTTTFLTTTTTKPTTTSTIPSTTTTLSTTTTASPSTTTTTPSTTTTTTPSSTTTTSTTTTTSPCSPPLNAAEIFIGTDVLLTDDLIWKKASPVGSCANSANGVTFYYDGNTPADSPDSVGAVWVGRWLKTNCASPCICTSTSCYVPEPGNPSDEPSIFLYPHCTALNQCFIAVVFGTDGALVNPSNPMDRFNSDDQVSDDVNDPSYPKVTKIGCNGCPVLT